VFLLSIIYYSFCENAGGEYPENGGVCESFFHDDGNVCVIRLRDHWYYGHVGGVHRVCVRGYAPIPREYVHEHDFR